MANSKTLKITDVTNGKDELSLFLNNENNFVIIIDNENGYPSGVISFDIDDAEALVSELKLLIKDYKYIKGL
jgi:hypothetical protein